MGVPRRRSGASGPPLRGSWAHTPPPPPALPFFDRPFYDEAARLGSDILRPTFPEQECIGARTIQSRVVLSQFTYLWSREKAWRAEAPGGPRDMIFGRGRNVWRAEVPGGPRRA